jgi:hypothetical protein
LPKAGALMRQRVKLNLVQHPTDQLIVCDNCGASFASFTTVKEAADWIEVHRCPSDQKTS